jgi:mono/diheme cytochrome c family protein
MAPRKALPLATLVVAALLAAISFVGVASAVPGNPARGKKLFLQNGVFCASCHTLKAVKSTGHDGPNLDNAKPGYARIVAFVTKGRDATKHWPTGMPRYSGQNAVITKAEIKDVAAFVYTATHG